MARIYAITRLARIVGGVITHVKTVVDRVTGAIRAALGAERDDATNTIVPPGSPLPEGTEKFDLTYWYWPTPADIAAGAPDDIKQDVAIQDIPVSASNNDVANMILYARAEKRDDMDYRFFKTP